MLAEVFVVAPEAKRRGCTDDESHEWERDEEEVEADVGAGGEPVDDLPGGSGWLVLLGLHFAHEEGEHEERGGGDEEQFDGGDGAFEEHSEYFVV